MTEKQRRKLVRDAAEEVCWSITIAVNTGLNDRDLAEFIREDVKKWADLVDWETYS